MTRRRHTILTDFNTTDVGDFLRDFRRHQDAAVPGLCPLTQFYFDHAHVIGAGFEPECLWIKTALLMTAAKIAAGNLPDHVTAAGQMVR